MSDRFTHPLLSEAKLAELAREEATRLTPGFSELLHRKILRAVRSAPAPLLNLDVSRRASSRNFWLMPALAATLALAGTPALLWRLSRVERVAVREARITPAPLQAVRVQTAPTSVNPAPASNADAPVLALDRAAQQMNERVKDVVQTAMVEQQWAGLDHDVRLATRFLVDQVPLRSAWQSDGAEQER